MILAEDRIEVAAADRSALLARIRDDYAPAAARRGLQLEGAFVSPPFDLIDQPGLLRVRWKIAGIEAWWAMRSAANDPAVPAFWDSERGRCARRRTIRRCPRSGIRSRR